MSPISDQFSFVVLFSEKFVGKDRISLSPLALYLLPFFLSLSLFVLQFFFSFYLFFSLFIFTLSFIHCLLSLLLAAD